MEMIVNKKLKGLVAAPFTAMNVDGSLNLACIERQAEHLVHTGVRGAFVCGTTGESHSLTLEERRRIVQRWIEVAGGDLAVIVHVGHNSLADARALAAHAQQLGATAIATLAPSFFRPASVEDLVEVCRETAAAAPALPFYFYHMPSMTGVCFPMANFLTCAAERIPTLAGIKFTYENLMDYRQCVAMADGRYDILFGRDEMLLAGLALGAQGAVGSTYNFAAPVYQRLIAAFRAGDLAAAQAEQARAIEMIALMARYGGLPAGKAMMGMIGIDCGPVRLPLRGLLPGEYAALRQGLEAIGFFEQVRPRPVSSGVRAESRLVDGRPTVSA